VEESIPSNTLSSLVDAKIPFSTFNSLVDKSAPLSMFISSAFAKTSVPERYRFVVKTL